jgi:uncharacterized membrane protein YbhN (UPF0104 family)
LKPPGGRKKQFFLLGVSLLLLVLLGTLVDWTEVWGAMSRARPVPLILAFLLTLLFPLFNLLRWLAVLRALDVPMTFGRAFRITMACWPVGTLTPGKAGELIKANAVTDRMVGLGSVIAERVIDVAVLGVFGVVFGLIIGSFWATIGGLAGIGGAAAVVLFARVLEGLLKGKKLGTKLHGFLAVAPRLAARPRFLLACVLASGTNWFLSMAQLALLLEAFGSTTRLPLIVAILPAATFAGLLPISIAGIGTRDAALLFLARGAVDPAALLASSIVYTFLGYFLLGVLGLPFLDALTARDHLVEDDKSGNGMKP